MALSTMPSETHWRHGVRSRYIAGCRCQKCRRANTAYEIFRNKERRAGRANPLVSALEARLYMREMSALGLGRRAFAHACGVGKTTLMRIRNGTKTRIRKHTAERILAVTIEALRPHAIVSAMCAHRQIRILQQNDYSKVRISKSLGTTSIQLHPEPIVRKKADKGPES